MASFNPGLFAFGVLLSTAVVGDARGGEPAPSCDFFVAEQIGQLCGMAGFFGVSTLRQSDVDSLFETYHGRAYRYRYETTWNDIGAGLVIQPSSGWRFSYYSHGDLYGHEQLTQGPNYQVSSKISREQQGWQSFLAEATLIDAKAGDAHVVLDAAETFEFINVPSGSGGNQHRDYARSALQLGLRRPLADTPYSVGLIGEAGLDDYTNPDVSDAFGSAQALLSHDASGVALGPEVTSSWTLTHSHNAFIDAQPAAEAGAGALLQPFRRTGWPILSDLTLKLDALHSLGQYHVNSTLPGSLATWEYTTNLRVYFRF